jgi:hypothetical protein
VHGAAFLISAAILPRMRGVGTIWAAASPMAGSTIPRHDARVTPVTFIRWAAILLLAIEAAVAAVYSFLLGSIAAEYWPGELAARQASALRQQSWLDMLTQVAFLLAIVVIYVALPAAIALAAARRRSWWLWAGAAYQVAWALLLTPPIVGFSPDIGRVGIVGAILFAVAALGQRRRRPRPRRTAASSRRG